MTSYQQQRGSAVVVSDGTRTWFTYLVYAFFVIGAALLVAMVYLVLVAPGLLAIDIAGGLIGVAAIIAGLGFLDRVPRHVTVDSDSIEMIYVLSRVRLKWDQLKAPVYSSQGFLDFRATSGTRGVWGGLTVTTKQARAILAHPSCPRFELPPNVIDELGRPG
jgi:hypothetical protein